MKILIADDDKTIHISFTKPLVNKGHEVLNAYDGEEAYEKAKAEMPDLILLDVTMPGMDGRDVCKKLKQSVDTKKITIVMLTAKDQQFDRQVGFEVGADDYIVKPCSVAFIERVLNKMK
nr:response regulator [Desulfobulbaceae bacterium]